MWSGFCWKPTKALWSFWGRFCTAGSHLNSAGGKNPWARAHIMLNIWCFMFLTCFSPNLFITCGSWQWTVQLMSLMTMMGLKRHQIIPPGTRWRIRTNTLLSCSLFEEVEEGIKERLNFQREGAHQRVLMTCLWSFRASHSVLDMKAVWVV